MLRFRKFRALLPVQFVNGHVVEIVFAIPRLIVHADDVQQRRFSGARRAHDRDELARLDVEIDAPQHVGLRRPCGKAFSMPRRLIMNSLRTRLSLIVVHEFRGVRTSFFFDNQTVEQVHDAIRMLRIARIVRDHADRCAATVQLAHQLHHRFTVC